MQVHRYLLKLNLKSLMSIKRPSCGLSIWLWNTLYKTTQHDLALNYFEINFFLVFKCSKTAGVFSLAQNKTFFFPLFFPKVPAIRTMASKIFGRIIILFFIFCTATNRSFHLLLELDEMKNFGANFSSKNEICWTYWWIVEWKIWIGNYWHGFDSS